MIERLTLEELLGAHAAGRLPAPLALAVATHLALAPESRRLYRRFEAAGGVLLEGIEPAPLRPDAWERLAARLDEPDEREVPPPTPPAAADAQALPWPLRAYLPDPAGRGLRWRDYGSMVEADLDLGTPGYRATLIRVRAGRSFPRHTHLGTELALVLEGSFHDEFGEYKVGDLAIADETVEHRPTAASDQDWLWLRLLEGNRVRLTGPFGRFLDPVWHP